VTTTYLAAAALEQLHHAQAELDRHLATGLEGRCRTCQQAEPCPAPLTANATFAKYGRLPRRQPGLTHIEADHIESSGLARFRWFVHVGPGDSR
jgi:hypothetical protein